MSVDMDLDAWLDTAFPRLLPDFLQKQRWFGSKARPIQAVDVEDAVWLAGSRHRCALTVAGVRYADGARERYVMLLAFFDERSGLPVVGRLEQSGSTIWAVEAAIDADVALALLRRFASPQALPMLRGGSLRYGDAGDTAVRALTRARESGSIRPVGTEQSNTSLRLDRTLVFKLFRKLDTGENPELEVSRFLTTRTAFRAMPMLHGSLTYVSARGESSTVGVLQDWIESRGDGWGYVVGLLRQPTAGTSGEPLRRDLFALGVTTADFHAALAADATEPAFAPEPVIAADMEAWQASLVDRASRLFPLVERTIPGWSENTRRLGESLLELRGRAATLAGVPEQARSGGFQKIRIHGDYHLGQVLRTPDGFALLDFEGEPARPLAERRLKHCALKDVAGMIRSCDYAVEAARQHDSNGTGDAPSGQRLSGSFLDGYLASAIAHRAVFLPGDRRAIDAWLDFFEFEKALYEVEYEINNRPAWVHIPLRGILRILRGPA